MNSSILEYQVTEPPTSDGVQERAIASLGIKRKIARGLMELTLTSKQEVPKPVAQHLVMRIVRPTFNDDGTLSTLEGRVLELDGEERGQYQNVTVRVDEVLAEAATASVVVIQP